MKPSKLELIKQTTSFLGEIESLKPQKETLDWYLSNHLKKYLVSVKKADKPLEIRNATGILSRFCTESMDWDTELYKKCTVITSIGFKLGKEN